MSASASVAQLEIGFGPRPAKVDPHELAFFEFHRSNPGVLTRLVELARDERAKQVEAGIVKPRVAIKAIWEDLRTELRGKRVQGGGPVKLDNNHTAFYARKIAAEHPDLAKVFKTRRRNS